MIGAGRYGGTAGSKPELLFVAGVDSPVATPPSGSLGTIAPFSPTLGTTSIVESYRIYEEKSFERMWITEEGSKLLSS
ncbi:unnamed protein product, partial [Dovyalis caffra]